MKKRELTAVYSAGLMQGIALVAFSAANTLFKNPKAHEIDNLYVVDTSFFPSIGAFNPSLKPMKN